MTAPEPHIECDRCGADLEGEYRVRRYYIDDPAEYGLVNPVYAAIMDWLGYEYVVEESVCPDCPDGGLRMDDPRGDLGDHALHAVTAAIVFASAVNAINSPEIALTAVETGVLLVVSGAVLVGEYLQIGRLKQSHITDILRAAYRKRDDDREPVEAARDAYLRGEIDEDDLERRLTEHYHDDRDRESERVVER